MFNRNIREKIQRLRTDYDFTIKEAIGIALLMENNELLEEHIRLLKKKE